MHLQSKLIAIQAQALARIHTNMPRNQQHLKKLQAFKIVISKISRLGWSVTRQNVRKTLQRHIVYLYFLAKGTYIQN
jgi:hypothetical protein